MKTASQSLEKCVFIDTFGCLLEIWLTGHGNFHVFWEMVWKQNKKFRLYSKLNSFFGQNKSATVCHKVKLVQTFSRAAATFFQKINRKKLKLTQIESESWFFVVFSTAYTHRRLIAGQSCWWAVVSFIHDFFAAAFSLSSNLNVCPRSLMTLTTFLWIFVFFFRRVDGKQEATRPKVYFLAE